MKAPQCHPYCMEIHEGDPRRVIEDKEALREMAEESGDPDFLPPVDCPRKGYSPTWWDRLHDWVWGYGSA